MKKIVLPGLVAGVAMLAVGFVISWLSQMAVSKIAAEMKNSALFRPFNDPLMILYFLYPFVLGIILAWVWNKSKTLFKGENRGLKFGLTIGLISAIPGMLITYASFAISGATVISWLISGFANAIVAGWILARMNR